MKLLVLDLDETLIFGTERELERPCDFSVGPYFVYLLAEGETGMDGREGVR